MKNRKITNYLVTPMPMGGGVRFWNPQNRDGVPGGPKTFYNGSLWGPTIKCPKNLEGTDVKIYKCVLHGYWFIPSV